MTKLLDYYGLWALDPASCDYGSFVAPPLSAVYTILPDAEKLHFHVRWLDGASKAHHMAFATPQDGEPVSAPDGTSTLRTVLEDGALTSIVERDGTAIHTTRRTLDDEGMHVQQRILTDLGFQELSARYTRTFAKQVLVYRRDLKMRKGKIAAQCAHASMAVFFQRNEGSPHELRVRLDGPMASWVGGRFTKVCLSCEDEDALRTAYELARERGIPCAIITDAGRTEFHGVPTKTAIALGPAAIPEIDAITGPNGQVSCKLA